MRSFGTKLIITILISSFGIFYQIKDVKSADNIAFVSGAFKRTIPVKSFEELANTGKAPVKPLVPL